MVSCARFMPSNALSAARRFNHKVRSGQDRWDDSEITPAIWIRTKKNPVCDWAGFFS